jgi:D-serine deaminase-like pyridoxal phosphate-dependent protein
MNYRELSTPALAIDLGIVERNLDRMALYCREHGLRLRPHTKTHKTPEVARMQLDRGASGLTVAKVGEAEVMAAAHDAEILVAGGGSTPSGKLHCLTLPSPFFPLGG